MDVRPKVVVPCSTMEQGLEHHYYSFEVVGYCRVVAVEELAVVAAVVVDGVDEARCCYCLLW